MQVPRTALRRRGFITSLLVILLVSLTGFVAAEYEENITFTNPFPDNQRSFGSVVAVDGDIAAVYAPGALDADDDRVENERVYIYRRVNDTWQFEQALSRIPNDIPNDLGDTFGAALAVDSAGERIALQRRTISDNGSNRVDTSFVEVYAYNPTAGQWQLESTVSEIDLPDGADFLFRLTDFGAALALQGSTLLVGAPDDNADGVSSRGALHVFERVGTDYQLQTTLIGQTDVPGAQVVGFGSAVAMDGDTIAVTATASVFVFTGSGDTYTQQAELRRAGDLGQTLGFGVALEGDTILALGRGADNNPQFPGPGFQDATIYTRTDGQWTQGVTLTPPDVVADNRNAQAVALARGRAIVGFGRAVAVYSPTLGDYRLVDTLDYGPENFEKGAQLFAQGNTLLVGGTEDNPNDPINEATFYDLASLVSDPRIVDFGQVAQNTFVTRGATISNDGATQVTLSEFAFVRNNNAVPADRFSLVDDQSTCALGDVLAPGADCNVVIQLDTAQTGVLAEGDYELQVRGSGDLALVIPLIGEIFEPTPGTLEVNINSVNNGNIAVGDADIRSITVSNTGDLPVNITTLDLSNAGIYYIASNSSCLGGLTVLQAGESCTAVVVFQPTFDITYNTTLVIAGAGTSQSVTFTGDGFFLDNVRALPGAPDLGRVGLQGYAVQNLFVTNTTGGPVTITEITTSDASAYTILRDVGNCAVDQVLSDNGQCVLTLQFSPQVERAYLESVSVVTTNGTATNDLLGRGFAGVAPRVNITEEDVDFGDVGLETTATRTLTISNDGPEAADITAIRLGNNGEGAYAITGNGTCRLGTLFPGFDCSVEVSFTPPAAGTLEARLEIEIDFGAASMGRLMATGVEGEPAVFSPTDVVFVINRIGADVAVGDNAAADLNNDGVIDEQDVALIRAQLGDPKP